MIFCENCFNDKEIISIICSVPLLNTGKCPLCHNEGHLYNTDTQNFLTPYFEELLNIYAPSTTLPETYPRAKVRSLIDDLKDRWNIAVSSMQMFQSFLMGLLVFQSYTILCI